MRVAVTGVRLWALGPVTIVLFSALPSVQNVLAAQEASAPDFSGRWGRDAFNFEPIAGQPPPVENGWN